jgi:hypothetical protein
MYLCFVFGKYRLASDMYVASVSAVKVPREFTGDED